MPPHSKRHFYLIPPKHFSIEYSLNQWMDPQNQVDRELAQQQWDSLFAAYEKLGAEVESLTPHAGLPDQVFPGDAIFVYGNQAVASRFKVQERAAEVKPMVERFEARGYQVQHLPDGMHFEGNAEAILWNGQLLGGYGVRSDLEALDYLSKLLDIDVIPLEIKAPYFHLDLCVCPLNAETLAYVPDAFEESSRVRIETLDAKLIPVEQEEGLNFACNSMSLNNTVILSNLELKNFPRALEKAGFDVLALDLTEFAKSGGGAKCLTLEAYPEVK